MLTWRVIWAAFTFKPFLDFGPKERRSNGVDYRVDRRINCGYADWKPSINRVLGVADKSGQREQDEDGNWKPTQNIGKDNGNKSDTHFWLFLHGLNICGSSSRDVGSIEYGAVSPSHETSNSKVEDAKKCKTVFPGWILFARKLQRQT